MSLRCLERLVVGLILLASIAAHAAGELRICADPDNLPYSRSDGTGFENRIAEVVARAMDATPVYVWLPQGHGYVRKTLNAGVCDVIVGVPEGFDPVRTTRPYYRSMYVAVTRQPDPRFGDFADPHLRDVTIGVQLVGDDLAATPPGHALAQHALIENVRGYTVYGDGRQGERMVRDLARGTIDVALIWGAQGGYFAGKAAVPLRVSPLAQPPDLPNVPFEYSIAMGVRKRDAALAAELDAALDRSRAAVDAILAEYRVPRTDVPSAASAAATARYAEHAR